MEMRMPGSNNVDPASAWRNAFKAEWILLSEGRAAGANFESLIGRLYVANPDIDPRLAARQEWNRPHSLRSLPPALLPLQ